MPLKLKNAETSLLPPYFSYKCTTKKTEVSRINPLQSHSLILTHSMLIDNNGTECTINRVRSEASYTMRAFQGGLMDRGRDAAAHRNKIWNCFEYYCRVCLRYNVLYMWHSVGTVAHAVTPCHIANK